VKKIAHYEAQPIHNLSNLIHNLYRGYHEFGQHLQLNKNLPKENNRPKCENRQIWSPCSLHDLTTVQSYANAHFIQRQKRINENGRVFLDAVHNQGNQIGRIFVHWQIAYIQMYFGCFLIVRRISPYFFLSKSISFDKVIKRYQNVPFKCLPKPKGTKTGGWAVNKPSCNFAGIKRQLFRRKLVKIGRI
jgi:hypothetical protein